MPNGNKKWIFTWNNPPLLQAIDLFQSKWDNGEIDFCTMQLEQGQAGTIHLQGCLILKTRKTLASMKAMNPAIHFEIMRGKTFQAIQYCNKEDTRIDGPWTFGDKPPEQGQRTDLKTFIEYVKSHTELEIMENFPNEYLRFNRVIDRIKLHTVSQRTWEMEVIVYWGDSGSGKTRRAYDEAGTSVFFLSQGDKTQTLWWDGYTGQHTIILDDFYGWLPWSFILRLLDRYPFTVQIKGGTVPFTSRKVIFTSNTEPKYWYHSIPNGDVTPLIRRITKIENLIK